MLDVVVTVTVPTLLERDADDRVRLQCPITLKEPTAILAEAPDTINSISASDSPKALLENADRVNIYQGFPLAVTGALLSAICAAILSSISFTLSDPIIALHQVTQFS